MPHFRLAIAAAISCFVGLAISPSQAKTGGEPDAGASAHLQGYLTSQQMPDSVRLLGPPPANGSGTKAGDIATYKATRNLKGTPRWTLAMRDAQFGPAALMKEFSCAISVDLDPTAEPALFHLLSRVVEDSEAIEKRAKNAYKRPRPFVENGGPICVAKEDWLKNSYSYPSGHSTFSWTAALILAEIVPERASEILARARSYGESRVVCGVHYESDVQAGRITASALFSTLQDAPHFRVDLNQARSELAGVQASPSMQAHRAECRIEAEAAHDPVW